MSSDHDKIFQTHVSKWWNLELLSRNFERYVSACSDSTIHHQTNCSSLPPPAKKKSTILYLEKKKTWWWQHHAFSVLFLVFGLFVCFSRTTTRCKVEWIMNSLISQSALAQNLETSAWKKIKKKHQGKPTSTAEFYLGLNRATLNMCWCVVTSIKCLNVTGCNLLYQKKTNLLISTVTGHWLYSHTKVIAIKKLNNDSKILNFVCFGINEKLQVRPTTSGLVGIIQQWLCIGTCDCWLGDL